LAAASFTQVINSTAVDMDRFISLFGLLLMIGIAWALSSNRSKMNLRIILGGLGLQIVLALVMLTEPMNSYLFVGVESAFSLIDSCIAVGSKTVAETYDGNDLLLRTFAFGVLPTIIFFSTLMSVLYYLNIIQPVVRVMAWVMQRSLGISGAESLAAAANVFVGHTEAPLVVKPYIAKMTMSELNAMMVGGFATITGGLLAVYRGFGIPAGHLFAASVISAPAALLIAKIMQPETETPETMGEIPSKVEKRGTNVIEAAAIGASDGMKLAINVAAMLIAFLAMIALLDALLGGVGTLFGFTAEADRWSLAAVLGFFFYPLAFCMGIESGDCWEAAKLIGIKTTANEFIAYKALGDMRQPDSAIQLAPRTIIILTYALAGFSNFGAIGIQIGGIGGLVPERQKDLAKLGLRAMIGGTLACCMTACIAGVIVDEDSLPPLKPASVPIEILPPEPAPPEPAPPEPAPTSTDPNTTDPNTSDPGPLSQSQIDSAPALDEQARVQSFSARENGAGNSSARVVSFFDPVSESTNTIGRAGLNSESVCRHAPHGTTPPLEAIASCANSRWPVAMAEYNATRSAQQVRPKDPFSTLHPLKT
jgi:CNT family concentrative nucleoside transporter